MKRHLVWFRTDLRITHNPALQRALSGADDVVAIYIDSPGQWQQHGLGPRQLAFIQRNLQALEQALEAMGIVLHRLECATFEDIPERMRDFCQQQQIDALFANRETGVYELRRDRAVRDAIEPKFSMFEADCIVSPGELVTGSNEMYKVFTPFRNAWIKYFKAHGYKLLPAPEVAQQKALTSTEVDAESPWPAGEAAAQQQLQQFCREQLVDYKELRDFPALAATSSLSPYLAIGVLSTAQCLQAIEQQLGYLPLSPGEQGFAWFNELIWREFYRHLMVAYPRLSMHQPFKLETRLINWSQDKSHFQALLLDEPEPLGQDRGPNASRLVAAAAANCLSASLMFCLAKQDAPASSIHTEATCTMERNDKNRMRIGRIDVQITAADTLLDSKRRERCMQLFEDFCVVTQSLRQGFPVGVEVKNESGELLHKVDE